MKEEMPRTLPGTEQYAHVNDLHLRSGRWVYSDLSASFVRGRCHVNKEVACICESMAGGLYRETHLVWHLVNSELG